MHQLNAGISCQDQNEDEDEAEAEAEAEAALVLLVCHFETSQPLSYPTAETSPPVSPIRRVVKHVLESGQSIPEKSIHPRLWLSFLPWWPAMYEPVPCQT